MISGTVLGSVSVSLSDVYSVHRCLAVNGMMRLGRLLVTGLLCTYDGEDCIALDLKTLTWITPRPQAVITKHKWTHERAKLNFNKTYLTEHITDPPQPWNLPDESWSNLSSALTADWRRYDRGHDRCSKRNLYLVVKQVDTEHISKYFNVYSKMLC